ncbi:aarF domain-containing protein kinase 1 isoform X2 [Carcharodon carcharias]|nr:aarF domain-containing protein kinase 1 isoform X2 [Carcharodon carcharias]XP_041071261.1 aarF domain-containing protein kinase 1 isoform X2 [Carcharodon carcharias]XP_041071262.1 aarF domain-containing protein kinase 1 isoform X2 [Carcharodon carcharias]
MAKWFLRLGAVITGGLALSDLYVATHVDPNDVAFVRIVRAVATTAVISFDYMTSLKRTEYGTEEYETVKSQVHRRSAERLLNLCCANRGTFIKVGQHLGGLDYLLPEEYTSTLKILHSKAPQSSLQDIQQVVEEDLGKGIHELFVSFEETPLGAASWAQVHKAVLHDGSTVAVKVQHPKVRDQCAQDIILMETLVQGVSWMFPDFSFAWLVDEAKKNTPLELDFLKEGHNTEEVANMLKHFHFLKVPKIHWELSTSRVLTMEFMEGGQVNDREYMKKNGIDVNEISRNLGKLYSEMIFVNGFVHCDPHPGNVLVRKSTQTNKAEIVLLDHGLYQNLTEEFRLDYCHLWHSLIRTDMKGIEMYSKRLGAGDLYPLFACMLTARSWASITKGIDQMPVSKTEDMEIRVNAVKYLPRINELLNKVPRQMLLLLKTNDLLRGIETSLQTRASATYFINMSRCCVRALSRYERDKCKSWYGKLKISWAKTLDLWQINLYEVLLWIKASLLGSWIAGILGYDHPLQ